VSLGWQYYKNLRPADFASRLALDRLFSVYKFWVNWRSYDLCFAGIKSGGDPATSGWGGFQKSVDAYIARDNNRRLYRYRAAAAWLFGESWFRGMTRLKKQVMKFGDTLTYLHQQDLG
jgi:hypothetical protein